MARVNSDGAKVAAVIDVMEITGGMEGKTFSITGHLGRPRPEIVSIIQRAKGRFEERPKNMWGKSCYLITNADWTKNSLKGKVSSKYEEAKQQGINIITEAQFYDMLVANDPNSKDG